MKTLTRIVTGTSAAKCLAEELIDQSRWFSMTPLPEDEYEFVAKDESGLPKAFREKAQA